MCGDCGGMQKESDRLRGVLSEKDKSQVVDGTNPCLPGHGERPSLNQQRTNVCKGDYEKHLYEEQNEDICHIGPREPYKIPGYEGHVQSLQSRSGGTYGHDTHEALMASGQSNSSNSKNGHVCPAPLHQPYHLPGYTGHVPGLQNMVGGTYGQDTHKALYSVQPYPNRQENLSSYRPNGSKQVFGEESDANETSFNNGRKHVKFHKEDSVVSKGPYKKPEEHYLKPQYKYRIGDTYARTADVTLVDPCVNQESTVVVSTRELDDTQVVRVQKTLQDKVQEFPYINQPLRHRPMVPGFDAYVDALRGARGQCYEFNLPPSHHQLQQQLILQKGSVKKPYKSEESFSKENQNHGSNQSEDNLPYGYENYGNRQRYTNSVLYNFSSNYRQRQSTEWAPATMSRPDPPALDIPGELYSQHTGLLPGYTAHIPGALFRCGKTFTDDSRDARRALRGDRF